MRQRIHASAAMFCIEVRARKQHAASVDAVLKLGLRDRLEIDAVRPCRLKPAQTAGELAYSDVMRCPMVTEAHAVILCPRLQPRDVVRQAFARILDVSNTMNLAADPLIQPDRGRVAYAQIPC